MGYIHGGDEFNFVFKICSNCGNSGVKQWDACDKCGYYDNPYDKK